VSKKKGAELMAPFIREGEAAEAEERADAEGQVQSETVRADLSLGASGASAVEPRAASLEETITALRVQLGANAREGAQEGPVRENHRFALRAEEARLAEERARLERLSAELPGAATTAAA